MVERLICNEEIRGSIPLGSTSMKQRTFFEVLGATLTVLIPTAVIVSYLSGVELFWSAQAVWSVILAVGWAIVAGGYFHQGWLARSSADVSDVSLLLPCAVFVVQCVLFVKGVYYADWSLIWGALVVNSGVLFSIYNIIRARRKGNTA